MKTFAALAGTVLLLATAGAADPPKEVVDELRRLQGTWTVESWEEGGKALAGEDLKNRGVFFGANVFIFRKDGKVHQAGATQLDPAKSPKTVNFSVKEGEGKDGVMLGVYSLEGDTLKVCFDPQGQNRPENFSPEAKSGFTLVTLKKPRPAVEEAVDIVGKYRSEMVDGTTGKTVVTEVTVERRGDSYVLSYQRDGKVLFVGTALRRGDQLSMSWVSAGQVGVSLYKIEPGPKLTGDYTILGGIGMTAKETLTPWKKVD